MSNARQNTQRGGRWHTLEPALLIATLFLGQAVLSPLLDALVRARFGLDNARTSAFMTVHQLAEIAFGLAAGWLADRHRIGRWLVAAGLLGCGTCFAALPWVPAFGALLAVRVVEGVCSVTVISLLFARATQARHAGGSGRVLGWMSAAIPLAYLAGPVLVGAAGSARLVAIFAGVGAAQCAAGLLALRGALAPAGLDNDFQPPPRSAAAKPALRPTRALAWALAFNFADKFCFAALAMLPALMLRDGGSADAARAASRLMIAFWLSYLACAGWAARLAQRRGVWLPLLAGGALLGVGLVWLGRGAGPGVAADLYIAMALAGAGAAVRFVPVMLLAAGGAAPERRASVMAILGVSGSIGMTAGFAAAGILSRHSYSAAWGLAGGLQLACAAAWVAGRGLRALRRAAPVLQTTPQS